MVPDEALANVLQRANANMKQQLRIARPVTDVGHTAGMYCRGLALRVLSSFKDHDDFDGIMVGLPEADYHLEFTRSRRHPITPSPTPEDPLVFYYRSHEEWRLACERMDAAGFKAVGSFNPYWSARGRSYQDADGYRVVLQQAVWASAL
jgi:hypothetical protein